MSLKSTNVAGKRVLLRCDFNVPIKNGVITDDNRITEALPTVKYLLDGGAKLIICSHLGRPKGEFNLKYTLSPVAERLNQLLDGRVVFCNDVIGQDAKTKIAALKNGQAVLLENLRFHKEEEANDVEFSRQLADGVELFVFDAFGTAHRAHASTAGVVQHGFIKNAIAGFLMEKEIHYLTKVLSAPTRPFTLVLGGAKVSDKIEVIKSMLNKVDNLVIGGGMAFTFIKAMGYDVGKSLFEADKVELAVELIAKAKERKVRLFLPIDFRTAERFPDPIDAKCDSLVVSAFSMPPECMGLDIGTMTEQLFTDVIKQSGTVLWNGPMGVFENPEFAKGTFALASALSHASVSVVGGGDSAAAVISMGLKDKISHISTGGGACLELLEGKELPSITCLQK